GAHLSLPRRDGPSVINQYKPSYLCCASSSWTAQGARLHCHCQFCTLYRRTVPTQCVMRVEEGLSAATITGSAVRMLRDDSGAAVHGLVWLGDRKPAMESPVGSGPRGPGGSRDRNA
ncbi:hypothetical protein T310_0148, partial [Rasamsonia emersonii CBS 393.64]